MTLVVTIAASDAQLEQILALQRRYTRQALTAAEQDAEGFVFVEHTLPLLRRMAAELPQAIAMDAGRVVGYCLSLAPALRPDVPSLEPMFTQFERCSYGGRPLARHRFYVGGQVCVDRPYRGRGLLRRLYEAARDALPAPHDLCVTEVATRNAVSVRAHERVGFRPISTYSDGYEEWVVVAWPLGDTASGTT